MWNSLLTELKMDPDWEHFKSQTETAFKRGMSHVVVSDVVLVVFIKLFTVCLFVSHLCFVLLRMYFVVESRVVM